MITVPVHLGSRSYDVVVGHGARHELGALLPATASRAAIVTQAGIPLHIDVGIPFERFEIGHGEQHKTLATIEQLCRGFAGMGLTRHDVVVGLGGGMVTDVAGFAAAAWHRGVPVVHVATTLLAMIDAAIGGKTGVNLPPERPLGEAGGKNLIGAFWQPSGVICDLDALASLAPRELRCGRGEMAKYHFLTGDELLGMPESERIARCIEIKSDFVARDEREGGQRALLNYGHTLAHALEIETNYAIAHGEAVAVGLVYAAHLAHVLGRIPQARVAEHYAVVGGSYELDTRLPPGVEPGRLLAAMARDKKALAGLTFVLDGPVGPEVVSDVPVEAVTEALRLVANARS